MSSTRNSLNPTPDHSIPGGQVPRRNTLLMLVAASVAVVIAGAAIVTSFQLGYWTSLGPGPGFFPFWISAVLAGSTVVWLVQGLRGNSNVGVADMQPDTQPGTGEMEAVAESTGRNLPLWAILLTLIVTASLLNVIGYQLAMFAFLIFMLKVQGRRKWIISLVLAAAGSFGVFYLFTMALQVVLPTASIEFLRIAGL